jgi:hypothetical protein
MENPISKNKKSLTKICKIRSVKLKSTLCKIKNSARWNGKSAE